MSGARTRRPPRCARSPPGVAGLALAVGLAPCSTALPACGDALAAQGDEVQYRLDDGPCLHAMREGILVRIDDTAGRARWPRFESKAASHGIGSCLALPLIADGKPVGALNLYARAAGA